MTIALAKASQKKCTSASKKCSDAANLSLEERKNISIQSLAKTSTITDISAHMNVSRKFTYKQKKIGEEALNKAFTPVPKDDNVLFYLPITKTWIRHFVLALILICHSSFRGVIEILDSMFDYHNMSLGTIHNIVMEAAQKAADINKKEGLSKIRHGAHDELFQN
ncbi:MAG: hypothetical protein HQK66_13260, partial [Desulfamplus sp.]|nr:hypothetical protein [Desulfamplus sp.]